MLAARMPSPSPTPRRTLAARIKRLPFRVVRSTLLRAARARPRAGADDRRVVILLISAWGMGGTIRAALNLAGHLAAQGRDVEIISWYRRRDRSFFGEFPPGVRVTALEDQRPGARYGVLVRLARRLLRTRSSVLLHPADRLYEEGNLWTDVQLVRRLRRSSGVLIGTRPSLNLLIGEISPPGFITIGEEQMHLAHHARTLRRAMPHHYPKLDAFAVLTQRDVEEYGALLDGQAKIVRIPNTVRDMGGSRADLAQKTVLAAGRLRMQKGFDFLIPAFAQVASEHPDWRLRICGSGRLRGRLQAQIDELGVADVVALEGPSERLGDEMEQASIFALSSRFEGFPLILLEAMSKGMGVVAFDCPTGPADIIDDHRNGILVPPQDVDAFAQGLRELMGDEELRRRCGAAAVETAAAYTMDAIGPQWDELLERLRSER
jgi:glycosyltransferase involved in cell wall biosynthesis